MLLHDHMLSVTRFQSDTKGYSNFRVTRAQRAKSLGSFISKRFYGWLVNGDDLSPTYEPIQNNSIEDALWYDVRHGSCVPPPPSIMISFLRERFIMDLFVGPLIRGLLWISFVLLPYLLFFAIVICTVHCWGKGRERRPLSSHILDG